MENIKHDLQEYIGTVQPEYIQIQSFVSWMMIHHPEKRLPSLPAVGTALRELGYEKKQVILRQRQGDQPGRSETRWYKPMSFSPADANIVCQVLDGSVPMLQRAYGESDIDRARRIVQRVDAAFAGLTNNDYWDSERTRWIADRLIPRLALAPQELGQIAQ